MKIQNYKVAIVILMSAIFLTSCLNAKFKSQSSLVELEGNPTTGYTWSYEIYDESIIKIDEKVESLGDKGVMGAPSRFEYTIKSLKAGNTVVRFEYKRPWEEDPIEVRFIDVHVDEKGGMVVNAFKSVSMDEGLNLIAQDEDAVLVDVRRPDEFAAAHIPGAVMLTNETISAETALRVLPDKNQSVYLYCRTGRRSKEAARKLVSLGYTDVTEMGGIVDYKGEVER
ncbi:MAG: protease inhibitor I42 family protein [Treponemataceae bacterium]|nr:protease inhibitor I42 family protein [Treponemataceae bacterium]